jgi:membrane protein required for colicin V production
MNIIDIIILIILGLSAFGGLKDGFLKKLIMLVSLIIALLFATKFSASFVKIFMSAFGFSYVLALITCYIIVFLIINIISNYIYKKIVDASTIISIWDKLGGAVLGVIESALILSLIFLFLNMLNIPSRELRDKSLLFYPIYNFAPDVFNYLKGIIPGTNDFFNQIKTKI